MLYFIYSHSWKITKLYQQEESKQLCKNVIKSKQFDEQTRNMNKQYTRINSRHYESCNPTLFTETNCKNTRVAIMSAAVCLFYWMVKAYLDYRFSNRL